MKPEELRVGNKIAWSPFASMGKGQDTVTVRMLGYAQLMEPIPLTEEWLIRLGFTYIKNTVGGFEKWECQTPVKGMYIKIIDKRFSWAVGHYTDYILYVHQLQNLYFALTGNELTIKP